MKHSIRVKLIILMLVALILPAAVFGATSIVSTQKMTDEYGHQNVTLMCEKKAMEINNIFNQLEQSVYYMCINALDEVSNPMNLVDSIYYENYEEKMRSILWNTGNNTDGAIAVYLRLNPDIYGGTAGFFFTRDELGTEMKLTTATDLTKYPEDDVEHVGWYYQPIKAGKPIWMSPYYNKNIGVYMISYVVPLVKDDITLGVLGIDINFDYITEQIDEIKVYDSGYAYITDSDGNIVYHPSLKAGAKSTIDHGWWNSSSSLKNGMVINIIAKENEINESRNQLINKLVISTFILMFLFIMATIFITNKMTSPLKRLNSIANEITEGNYDVDFNFETPNDEIGQLKNSFEKTVDTLKEYMVYMNSLAYKDELTGVRNRTAYAYQVNLMEEAIENEEELSCVIAVFDVNNLKKINDSLGHEKGDILIQGACKLICRIFNHSAVFRIGGDEFTAIIKDLDDNKIKDLFVSFRKEMEATWSNENPELRVSVAYGYSRYNPKSDEKIESVFKRADEMMYTNKRHMKEKANESMN